jgi:hypothetical protein
MAGTFLRQHCIENKIISAHNASIILWSFSANWFQNNETIRQLQRKQNARLQLPHHCGDRHTNKMISPVLAQHHPRFPVPVIPFDSMNKDQSTFSLTHPMSDGSHGFWTCYKVHIETHMPRADHTDTTIAISRYNCADQIPKGKQQTLVRYRLQHKTIQLKHFLMYPPSSNCSSGPSRTLVFLRYQIN